MCGIAFSISTKPRESAHEGFIKSAVEALRHRGPDAQGFFNDGMVGMGHARLKIIDLSDRANQPFKNERYTLIFNGEIFNFLDLKEELKSKHEFKTSSDTEVLFYALVEWREAALEKLAGQFAFAFYDNKSGIVLVGRDITGIVPLYCAEKDGILFFASEIGPLLAVINPKLHYQAAWNYFMFRYAVGTQTMFDGVRRVPPSHYAKISLSDGKVEWERYFRVSRSAAPESPSSGGGKERQLAFNAMFDKVIERQAMADVPVGMYLSGGIDSTTVLKGFSNSHNDFQTFTLQFEPEDTEDLSRVEALQQRMGFKKNVVDFLRLTEEDLLDAVKSLEDLFGDIMIAANYQLAKEASKKIKVVLSGEGGDEVFFGYEHQVKLLKLKKLENWFALSVWAGPIVGALPPELISSTFNYPGKFGATEKAKIIKIVRALGEPAAAYCSAIELFSKEEAPVYFTQKFLSRVDLDAVPETIKRAFEEETFHDALYRVEQESVLLPINLTKQDRFAMRFSMEARVPLLDKDNIVFGQNLPRKLMFGGKKEILIRYGGYDPSTFIKKPFSPLNSKKYLNFIKAVCDKYVTKEKVEQGGIFRWEGVETLLEPAFRQEILPMKKLMAILIFTLWHDIFKVNDN